MPRVKFFLVNTIPSPPVPSNIMRKSKFDPVVILMCTVLLYYYIFIHGFPEIPCEEYGILNPGKCYLIHEGIVYSSLFAVFFTFLYLGGDKLEPFNRHFVVRYYYIFLKRCGIKITEGKNLTKEIP